MELNQQLVRWLFEWLSIFPLGKTPFLSRGNAPAALPAPDLPHTGAAHRDVLGWRGTSPGSEETSSSINTHPAEAWWGDVRGREAISCFPHERMSFLSVNV